MVNSKAIHCSTPSATYSTCSTSTRGSRQIIPRMGRKKADRWRHRATLVNQGATLVFWCFCPAFREWLHDARCYHLEGCHQIGKLLMCALDMFHPFQLGSGLTMTYRLQSTRWCEVETPEPIFRSCGILILSATGKKWFRCLFWIARALKPMQQGALRTGDARDA